jgi:hypothetical protein
MGYKAPAIHRPGTYTTDCKCKDNGFADYRDAVRHVETCTEAMRIYYNGAYTA